MHTINTIITVVANILCNNGLVFVCLMCMNVIYMYYHIVRKGTATEEHGLKPSFFVRQLGQIWQAFIVQLRTNSLTQVSAG